MQFWKDFTEILQRVLELLAILAGGVWTYFNCFRGENLCSL